jgi:hypothetical protein
MMRLVLIGLLLVAGCTDKGHKATVSLTITGVDHSFVTASAEVDQQVTDGPYSVYLLRDDGQEGPFLGLRRFSGNPVAHFWLRAPKAGSSELERYECYVPGVLSDGRETLGWTRADGKPRNRQETGESGCQAAVTVEGGELVLTYDAMVRPKDGGDVTEPLAVKGRATVTLR